MATASKYPAGNRSHKDATINRVNRGIYLLAFYFWRAPPTRKMTGAVPMVEYGFVSEKTVLPVADTLGHEAGLTFSRRI